jgi:hypothetical protein
MRALYNSGVKYPERPFGLIPATTAGVKYPEGFFGLIPGKVFFFTVK